MDRRLQLIAHLYEEPIDGLEPLESLLQDPELREEYRVLREARFRLDHRDRARPDAATIDAIVAAAGVRPVPASRWIDRAPLRLVRQKRVLAPVLAAAAVVLLAIAVRPWSLVAPTPPAEPALAEEAAAPSPAESLLSSLPPAPPEPALAAAGREAESEADVATGSLPPWDSGGNVRQLSRRIAALRAAGIDEWDGEAVPLELFPADSGPRDLRPAGARPPGN